MVALGAEAQESQGLLALVVLGLLVQGDLHGHVHALDEMVDADNDPAAGLDRLREKHSLSSI